MIKDITVVRAFVSPSGSNPGQWTDNSQFSVNNGTQLYLLEPKLPNLHKSIVSQLEYTPGSDKIQNTVNANELFDQTPILESDLLKSMDTCSFNRLNFVSSTDHFSFGRISDPLIVKYQWSPVSKSSKDCMLGVLLNTGEVLVFKRVGRLARDYQIVYNLFDLTARDLGLSEDSLGEINVDSHQYCQLRNKDFKLVEHKGRLIISVLNESDEIRFYQGGEFWLSVALQGITSYDLFEQDDALYVAYVTVRNEVVIYSVEKSVGETIIKPTRFRVSRLEWHEDMNSLLVVYLNQLFVYQNGKLLTVQLDSPRVSSLASLGSNRILVAYECGKFDVVSLSSDFQKSTVVPSKTLNKFVSTRLINYQVANSLIDQKVSPTNEIIVYGMSLNKENGVLAVVYKFVPKNDLNYKILSKSEYHIAFRPIRDIDEEYRSPLVHHSHTSLGYLNSVWFTRYNEMQVFPKDFQVYTSFEFIDKFVKSMKSFKESLGFTGASSISVEDLGDEGKELTSLLTNKFTTDAVVTKYQRWFNLNLVFINAIKSLAAKLQNIELPTSPVENLKQFCSELEKESKQLKFFIHEYLYKLIILSDYKPTHPMDKFILMNYHSMVKQPDLVLPFDDDRVIIDFATDYVTETFSASRSMHFWELIHSHSQNEWSRCTLTLIPILEDVNGCDQLNQFNYTAREDLVGLARLLLDTLNYCIITGNSVYRTG